MKLCISEATTMPATFAEDVQAYADAGCPAMEVWLTKLETHLETHSADATRQLLASPRPRALPRPPTRAGCSSPRGRHGRRISITSAAALICASIFAFPR